MNTNPISGMQELLPEAQVAFDDLKLTVMDAYRRHGFLRIETPVIERNEILFAKAGGETEKQVYRVFKTAETADESEQALRFDHTVPLARYVVEHENNLAFPFKVTQVGRNFRGERAQKGRFREFYQADVDVIGRGELPLEYDADVILTLLDAFSGMNLKAEVVARVSNRKILNGLISEYGLEEKSRDIFSIIDHSEKVPMEKTLAGFSEIGLSDEVRDVIVRFMEIHGDYADVVRELNELGIQNETFRAGVAELEKLMKLVGAGISRRGAEKGAEESSETGVEIRSEVGAEARPKVRAEADMRIVRGLDYYTGTVFEFNLPEYPGLGSVSGGGRYENLAGYFTEQKLPGVGGSIGLTRLFYVLTEYNLVKSQALERPVEIAVVPISENEVEYAMKVADEFRDKGDSAVVVFSGKRLGDKLNYASKIAKKAIVIGENEVQTGEYQIKELN